MQLFLRPYSGKYRLMIDFYKRWPNGKKQILYALYFSKKRDQQLEAEVKSETEAESGETAKQSQNNLFDISRLPIGYVMKLADEYL